MARFVVDSSVLLRLFIEEPSSQQDSVDKLLRAVVERGDSLVIHPLVIAEVVFVLNGPRLRVAREDQVEAIRLMLAMRADLGDAEWLAVATDFYAIGTSGWLDCLLAALALAETQGNVLALDRDFRRFTGLNVEPG